MSTLYQSSDRSSPSTHCGLHTTPAVHDSDVSGDKFGLEPPVNGLLVWHGKLVHGTLPWPSWMKPGGTAAVQVGLPAPGCPAEHGSVYDSKLVPVPPNRSLMLGARKPSA